MKNRTQTKFEVLAVGDANQPQAPLQPRCLVVLPARNAASELVSGRMSAARIQ